MVTIAAEKTDQARLQLFGWWDLRRGGSSIRVGSREQRLLALLALVGRRSRAQLAGTLWPDSNEHHALANLRAAVWQIRQAAADLLVVQPHMLDLQPQLRVDVTDMVGYASAVAETPSGYDGREAVPVLAHGDLLPGWYDDWVLFERERLDHLRIHALEALGRSALQTGRATDAELAARAALGIEPLHEGANLLLIRAFLAAGSTVDAVRHFHSYRHRLATELGIRPSSQLIDAVRPLLLPRQR